MFNLNEIKELIKLVDETSVHELEIENEGTRLLIRKPDLSAQAPVLASVPVQTIAQAAAPVQAAVAVQEVSSIAEAVPAGAPATNDESLHQITSPMVGTFYAAPSPTSPAFVQRGDKVTAKTVVCIIEAMKLMNEIEAEVKGEIVEVLVENGQLIEFGQPLFLVRPE